MGLSEGNKNKTIKDLFDDACKNQKTYEELKEEIVENPEILKRKYDNYHECHPTLFLMAVKKPHYEFVQFLLELDKQKTVDRVIDQVNSQRHNALRIAVIANNFEMVKLLTEVQYKIDLNCKDNQGFTPLLYAIGNRNSKEVLDHLLIQKDVEKNAVDNRGYNALHLAIESADADHIQNDLDKIRKLIEAGVSLDQKNEDGHTPFMLAVKGKKDWIVQEFVQKFPRETKGKLSDELAHLQQKSYRGLGIGLASAAIFIPSMLVVPFNEMLKSAVSKLFKSSKAGLFLNTFISGVCATMLVGGTVLYMRDKEKDGPKIKELKTDLTEINTIMNTR